MSHRRPRDQFRDRLKEIFFLVHSAFPPGPDLAFHFSLRLGTTPEYRVRKPRLRREGEGSRSLGCLGCGRRRGRVPRERCRRHGNVRHHVHIVQICILDAIKGIFAVRVTDIATVTIAKAYLVALLS